MLISFHNTKKKSVSDKYSPKKNPTKTPPAYSVLKPLTSSDSPSTKSTGVRPTSAEKTRIATIHHKLIFLISTINSKISYANILMIARNLPNIEYML